MNGQRKAPTSVAFAPAFQKRLDRLASKYGISRSQLITRMLVLTIDSVERPEVEWIKISRRDFERNLTM
jgi:predicted transcriptional regulator